MHFMMLPIINKFSFFFFFFFFLLLIPGSLFSTAFAGRGSKFVSKMDAGYHVEEGTSKNKEEIAVIHERLLWRDYGRYDPSPNFYRPRHKMIPN